MVEVGTRVFWIWSAASLSAWRSGSSAVSLMVVVVVGVLLEAGLGREGGKVIILSLGLIRGVVGEEEGVIVGRLRWVRVGD